MSPNPVKTFWTVYLTGIVTLVVVVLVMALFWWLGTH